MERDQLRPLERTVRRLADSGMPTADIAWRLRRSPGHVDRILELSQLPRQRDDSDRQTGDGLRPVERCVLRARNNGHDLAEIAARMRRTPAHVGRVEEYATYKLQRGAKR